MTLQFYEHYEKYIKPNVSNLTESANNLSKSPSGMAGLFAIVLLFILIIVFAVNIIKGKEATYMNKISIQQQILALDYVPITYDTSNNIVVVEPSGNGSNGSYNINDYYIYGSYNSCNISGRNTNNYMNINALKYVISQGVRFIDFEIYNLDNDPIIATSSIPDNYFIKESYNYIRFEEALNIIISNAFNPTYAPNPIDPILLNLRIKSTNMTMMTNLANYLYTYDNYLAGPKYSYEYLSCKMGPSTNVIDKNIDCVNNNFTQLPLYFFKGKIIIIVDRSNTAILNCDKLMEFVNITTNSINCRLITNHDMKYSPDQTELLEYNKKNMTIVTPDVGVNTENPSINSATQLGIQINAINFSNNDDNMNSDMNYFITERRAFILKPLKLRYIPIYITVPDPNPEGYSFSARTENIPGLGETQF